MMTSAPGECPGDVIIRRWREAGLTVPCKVRPKLFTLDGDVVVRKLGVLASGDRQAAGSALVRCIASAPPFTQHLHSPTWIAASSSKHP